jgi:hypothetical protein
VGFAFPPHPPIANFYVLFAGSKGKGRFPATQTLSPCPQFGSRLLEAALAFIYSIYLFIGSQDAREW